MTNTNSLPKETILRKSHALFLTYGIKSVTMDDIATKCGISKRTLYTVFDREKLVSAIIERLLEKYVRTLELYKRATGKPEEKLYSLLAIIKRNCEDFSADFIHDLKIHYPSVWLHVDSFKKEFLSKTIEDNLADGIRSGYYRQDLDRKVAVDLYIFLLEAVLENKVTVRSRMTPLFLINDINKYFLSSILI